MVKHSCATCWLALVLLCCLVPTLIEAQQQPKNWWEKKTPQSGIQHAHTPQQPPAKPVQHPVQPPPVQHPERPGHPVQPPYVKGPGPTQKPMTPGLTPSCDVEEIVRVPCGLDGITEYTCDAIGCCFDGHDCYYGKAVTVQCTKDAQFIVVVARDATLPQIDLDSITLLGEGQGCTHVDSNSGFAIYQFPVTSCGTLVKEESGRIIYENRMASSYEVGVGPRGAITRDTTYELLFQCRYTGDVVETLVIVVRDLPPPFPAIGAGHLEVVLRLGNGQCISKGCNEEDVAYSSYYTLADYPVTKVLRDPIFVDVSIVGRTDHIHLTLGHCWTTINPNPHTLPQWDLLVNGCPYKDEPARYLTNLVAVDGQSSGVMYPSHHKRFIFKMFTFVDQSSVVPLREQVYIHCSTTVCVPGSGNNCEQCPRRGRRNVRDLKNTDAKIVVSSPMIVMTASQ